jgi:hypothetical protein
MIVWKYKIVGKSAIAYTKNCEYAEKKSRLGDIVYCKREKNMYRFAH